MNNVQYIATISIGNEISSISQDMIKDVELFENKNQSRNSNKLSIFFDSFNSYTLISFIKISRLPIWYYLGKPFQIYTKTDVTLQFFQEIIKLTLDKDTGLLIKCDSTEGVDEIDKNFYLLIYVIRDQSSFIINALPLLMTNNLILESVKDCYRPDHIQTPIFIELNAPIQKSKNDILDNFIGRPSVHPFVTSTKPPVKPKQEINNINDYEFFNKTVLNLIYSELRLRNINKTTNDYQLIITNVKNSTLFAFRKKLSQRSNLNIKLNDIRDVVIKLMDLFV